MKRDDLQLYYCSQLRCKMTRRGCLSLQKRAKQQKLFERGIITNSNIVYLFDYLPCVPCPCSNPIARA